jgi:hypothetical protein
VARPAWVPGTRGLRRVQALGRPPAPAGMLPAGRAAFHRQGAPRCRGLSCPAGAALPRDSPRVTQAHPVGREADAAGGALLERRPHALPMGRAAVSHRDLAWRPGERRERLARVDLADAHRKTLPGHQGQCAREAMIGAWGAWGLHTAGVDHAKAPPLWQGGHGESGEQAPPPRFHPWTPGTHALRHRLVRPGLLQGRQGAGHLAQRWVQAIREEDHPSELRGCLALLGPPKRLACAGHLHGLRGEVWQKCLAERIWCGQGQRQGTSLL